MPVDTPTTTTTRTAGATDTSESFLAARSLRERGGSLSAACGCVFAFLGFMMGSARLGDNSLFTHIATGRLLTHGELGSLWNGMPDPYTATSRGSSWIVQSWLASLFYGVLDQIGGGAALRISFGVTTA